MTREEIKKAMRDTKKEVAIKNLHKLLSLVEGYPEYEDCIGYAIEKLEQEPKTGHWIKGYTFPDGAYWKCDKCNELIKVKIPMRYCNNCGAKMESEDT